MSKISLWKLLLAGFHPISTNLLGSFHVDIGIYSKSQSGERILSGHIINFLSYLSSESNLPNWQLVHREIRQFALYSPENPAVDGLLHDMATNEITEIGNTYSSSLDNMLLRLQTTNA